MRSLEQETVIKINIFKADFFSTFATVSHPAQINKDVGIMDGKGHNGPWITFVTCASSGVPRRKVLPHMNNMDKTKRQGDIQKYLFQPI